MNSPLEGTYWKLSRVYDIEVVNAPLQEEPHLVLHASTRSVSGSTGYSQLTGAYALEGERLSFGPLVTARRTSLLGLDLEANLVAAFPSVTRWRIQGEQLRLLDWEGKCVMRFEAATRERT